MQSEAPGQRPSGPDDDNLSQSNKRRRTSERSTRTIPEPSESSNALATGRRTLTKASPQSGSSRDMTPPESEGAIKYTRTGRVSKATKGQRVHHCDECGKTYTRAEHLRRHQQNHKPGAFPCDVPGCGRSFYREDLLIRHKARHNDPLNPPSRQGSPTSQGSTPAERSRPLPRASGVSRSSTIAEPESEHVEASQAPSRNSGQETGTRTVKRYLDLNTLQRGGPVAIDTNGPYPPEYPLGGFHWDPSPEYSPAGGYDSPTNNGFYLSSGPPYFQPQLGRARHSSNASYLGYYPPPQTSRSPVSAGSSTINLAHWGHRTHDVGFQHFGASSESDGSFVNGFGIYNGHMADQQFLLGTVGSSRLLTPKDRDFMEHDDLLIPTTSPRGSSVDLPLDETTYTNEERYSGAYWRWIHPFFPVVHRPSFILLNASPLLKAAMLALGAHALGDAADRTNARLIHERCVKVMKKRTLNNWHSFRTCDMQAIFLIEVYSIYKARRPPLYLSKIFQEVYEHLANDVSILSGEVPSDETMRGTVIGGSGYLDDLTLSIDHKSKQRLFLACYMLDQQHAELFGRERTNCFSGASANLPFPRSQSPWDSTHDQRAASEPARRRVWEALGGGNLDESAQQPYDTFQSMLMMACLGDDVDTEGFGFGIRANKESSPILSAMEQSPGINIAYHTFMLCKHTPIRNLLAVAGESWVMAEKLSSPAKFSEAQNKARQWASGFADLNMDLTMDAEQAPVNGALKHALKILELNRNHPRTGLLFQEWAVYLASVVVWARAYVTSNRPQSQLGPRLAVPNPAQPRLAAYELDQAVAAVINAGPNCDIDIDQARNVLIWTEARLKTVDIPHNCGLTNGALDVLGKLVARGSEEGWFGTL